MARTATAGKPAPDPDPQPKPVFRELFGDELIRSAGFKIVARPKGKPATWQRKGHLIDESLAIDLATREQAKLKQALHEQATAE